MIFTTVIHEGMEGAPEWPPFLALCYGEWQRVVYCAGAYGDKGIFTYDRRDATDEIKFTRWMDLPGKEEE